MVETIQQHQEHDITEKVFFHRDMGRGFFYALSSLAAFCSGHLIGGNSAPSRAWLILPIPWLLTVPFFIYYTYYFDYPRPGSQPGHQRPRIWRNSVMAFCGIVVLFLAVILFLIYDSFPPLIFFGYLAAYPLLFYAYLGFLHSVYTAKHDALYLLQNHLRHVLFWPLILSVGISLYFGGRFSDYLFAADPQQNYEVVALVADAVVFSILLLYFYLTEAFPLKRTLVSLGIVICALMASPLVISRFLTVNRAIQDCAAATLLATACSAYIAVFEGWKVAWYLAARDDADAAIRYSVAILAALMFSAFLLPFTFAHSALSGVFLWGSTLHATGAFFLWYVWGGKIRWIRAFRWDWLEVVFGSSFLVLLTVGTAGDWHPYKPIETLKGHVLFLGACFFSLGLSLGKSIWQEFDRIRAMPEHADGRLVGILVSVFGKRVTFLRAIPSVAFFFLALLLCTTAFRERTGSRADHVVHVYLILVLLSIVSFVVEKLRGTDGDSSSGTSVVCLIGAVLHVTRFPTSVLTGLCVLLPGLSRGRGIIESFFSCLPFLLAAMGGFALNDYCDAERDRVNMPHRPIPSGRIERHDVLRIAVILLVSSTVLALIVSDSFLDLFYYMLPVAGMCLYGDVVRKWPVLKGAFTGAVAASVIGYVITSHSYCGIYFLLPISTFLFVTGRELLMDIRDIPGDKLNGVLTFAVIWGKTISTVTAFGVLSVAVLTLLPVAAYSTVLHHHILLAACGLIVSVGFVAWCRSGERGRRVTLYMLWIPMLLGAMMLLD